MDKQQLKLWFEVPRTIAVLGLSAKPDRASYEVAAYMQQHGHVIVPVNPVYAGQTILGNHCFADLNQAAKVHSLDLINCFRRAEDLNDDLAQLLQVKPKMIWLQLGIINIELAEIMQNQGIAVVMDKCLKIEHRLAGVGLARQTSRE